MPIVVFAQTYTELVDRKTLTRQLISIFPQVIIMRDVIDSTLTHINKGNAHGTQRERTNKVYLST